MKAFGWRFAIILITHFCLAWAEQSVNWHPLQRHEDLDYDYNTKDMFTLDYIF